MKLSKFKKGFTLIEILLVVAILAVLLVVVFSALNPAQRMVDTRDARRWNDVNSILTAVHTCVVDGGTLAACGVTDDGVMREIVDMTGGVINAGCNAVCGVAADECEDMSPLLGSYLASLPQDPTTPADNHTSYSVVSNNGIVTIGACGAEGTAAIQVSR